MNLDGLLAGSDGDSFARMNTEFIVFFVASGRRVLIPMICLMLCGCALFVREGEMGLGIIPRQPATNIVIRTAIPKNTRAIRFSSDASGTRIRDQDKVTVTLTNTSATRTISFQNPGAFADIPPHGSLQLFDGSVAALIDGRYFRVSSGSGRTACELHIRFVSTPTLPAPIRISCSYSSPPL
jgi:hypothetical protein